MTERSDRPGGPGDVPIGRPPTNRRELSAKLLWIGAYLVFLGWPLEDLVSGRHSAAATALGAAGLAAFVVAYLSLVFRNVGRPFSARTVGTLLGTIAVLACVLAHSLGGSWLGLFVYVSVACGATLPRRGAYVAIPVNAALMYLVGRHSDEAEARNLLLITVLVGFGMIGVRQLVRTTVELRKARATVAQLAANEERLRLARDLHDLLGHSLSLITLKSELAGRMLPGRPEEAAQQVADIEQVSRQALVDVRAAVTGYRRARLAAELAGAHMALTAAGVAAQVPAEPDLTGVPEEVEAALAWSLREGVTNVVRHSGAARCVVSVTHRQTLDGPVLELAVEDDGTGGPARTVPGNGLAGLTERLEAAGGSLEAGRTRRGFRLLARVPAAGAPDVGSGA
ncbi:sensor histidine kinase [Streptomyces sp. J2-1]|nr:sensor histidine kinase [Streptomyces corallincola]MBV2353093.1 sensor histidine kinase [Streptomyces corallincola]